MMGTAALGIVFNVLIFLSLGGQHHHHYGMPCSGHGHAHHHGHRARGEHKDSAAVHNIVDSAACGESNVVADVVTLYCKCSYFDLKMGALESRLCVSYYP
jgi:Co/Zn/Cd efflux system component